MDLKTGNWTRFSKKGIDGKFANGDIFSFVGLATGATAKEQLELVAQIANSAGAITDEQGAELNNNGKKAVNEWFAHALIPANAPEFNPYKQMYFFLKDKTLSGIYSYRNLEGELIGYTIRTSDKESGKKLGVIPVAYCHNGKEGEELKEGWYQKGFSDNRLLSKLATEKEFVGDAERKTSAY